VVQWSLYYVEIGGSWLFYGSGQWGLGVVLVDYTRSGPSLLRRINARHSAYEGPTTTNEGLSIIQGPSTFNGIRPVVNGVTSTAYVFLIVVTEGSTATNEGYETANQMATGDGSLSDCIERGFRPFLRVPRCCIVATHNKSDQPLQMLLIAR
jgi:hypothetical protein